VPRVKVLLHDLSSDELIAGLQTPRWNSPSWSASPSATRPQASSFELLRTYPFVRAMTAAHPFAG